MTQQDDCISEARAMFNHIGIYGGCILARLIGFSDDGDDFYWHIMEMGGKESHASMVGGFESLLGKIDGYDRIDNLFALNGSPKQEEFRITMLPGGFLGVPSADKE